MSIRNDPRRKAEPETDTVRRESDYESYMLRIWDVSSSITHFTEKRGRMESSSDVTTASGERRVEENPLLDDDEPDVLQLTQNVAQDPMRGPDFVEKSQWVCKLLSHALSLLALLICFVWIHQLGGLAWGGGQAKLVFNWHPLMMLTAFFFMTVAALTFRFPFKSSDRRIVKWVHGSTWLVAALCASVALVAVFRSHNDPVSGLVANMYSLHSWMGATVIVFYLVQFVLALWTFAWPSSSPRRVKALVLKFHKLAGPSIYILTAGTILLGIQEKEGFVGCSYTVTEPDTFPLSNISRIPHVCITSHLMGFVVLAVTLSTIFALHDFSTHAATNERDR